MPLLRWKTLRRPGMTRQGFIHPGSRGTIRTAIGGGAEARAGTTSAPPRFGPLVAPDTAWVVPRLDEVTVAKEVSIQVCVSPDVPLGAYPPMENG